MSIVAAKSHVAAAQRALDELPGAALVTVARIHLNSAATALTALSLGANGPVAIGDGADGFTREIREGRDDHFFGPSVNFPGSMNGFMGKPA